MVAGTTGLKTISPGRARRPLRNDVENDHCPCSEGVPVTATGGRSTSSSITDHHDRVCVFEALGIQRTGRPVTARPMIRRWISDVPSKIV